MNFCDPCGESVCYTSHLNGRHDRLFSFIVEARRMHGRLLAQIDIYIVAKPGTIDREIKRVGERERERNHYQYM